jgi:hypothetical protein
MKNTVLVLTSIALLGLFVAPVHAQTLGEAAKREAERRARLKDTPQVFTNADLEALPSRGAPPAARPDAVLPTPAAEPSAANPAAPATASESPRRCRPRGCGATNSTGASARRSSAIGSRGCNPMPPPSTGASRG